MKKLVSIVLAMVMCFTLIACGNNDENNATVQAKIDEADGLVQEIYSFYKDNDLIVEGSQDQQDLDKILSNMELLKEKHKEVIDNGGYSDKDVVTVVDAMNSDIAKYQAVLDAIKQ